MSETSRSLYFNALKCICAAIIVLFLIGCSKHLDQASNQENGDWIISPTFNIGEHKIRGENLKFGIVDSPITAKKQIGIHWLLWGEQDELVRKSFKLTAVKEHSTKELLLLNDYAIAYGDNGAVAQVPSLITFPTEGVWKITSYLDDRKFSTIYINVLKE